MLWSLVIGYFHIIAFLSAMQVIVSPVWVLEKLPDKDATSWHEAEVWHLVCHRERKHGTCPPPYMQYLAADKLFDRRHQEKQSRIGRKWGTDRYMKNCNGDVSSLGWKSCLSYDEHHKSLGLLCLPSLLCIWRAQNCHAVHLWMTRKIGESIISKIWVSQQNEESGWDIAGTLLKLLGTEIVGRRGIKGTAGMHLFMQLSAIGIRSAGCGAWEVLCGFA